MAKSFKSYKTKIYTNQHLKIYSNPKKKQSKFIMFVVGIYFSIFLGIAMDII